MRRIDVYSDPGHAWIRVPLAELRERGFTVDECPRDARETHEHGPLSLTSYSYTNGRDAFLEEDADATRFLRELDRLGIAYSERTHYAYNESRIRRMGALTQAWIDYGPARAGLVLAINVDRWPVYRLDRWHKSAGCAQAWSARGAHWHTTPMAWMRPSDVARCEPVAVEVLS